MKKLTKIISEKTKKLLGFNGKEKCENNFKDIVQEKLIKTKKKPSCNNLLDSDVYACLDGLDREKYIFEILNVCLGTNKNE